MERKTSQPLQLFYCYARKDRALRDELDIHLTGLRRSGLVGTWYDGAISPGTPWEQEIKMHLDAAQVILLLVSPDFLHSEYCYGTEMMRALERHSRKEALVIPILLRPADWIDTPFSTLQVLPSNAQPITRWTDRDEAFENVTKDLRQVVNERFSQYATTSPSTTSKFASSKKPLIQASSFHKEQRELAFSQELPGEGKLDLLFDEINNRWSFIGQKPDERVKEILRKRKDNFVSSIVAFAVWLLFLLCLLYISLIWNMEAAQPYLTFSIDLIIFGLILGLIYIYNEYKHLKDIYIITNQRIISSMGRSHVKNREISLNIVHAVKIALPYKGTIQLLLRDGSKISLKGIKQPWQAKEAIQWLIHSQK